MPKEVLAAGNRPDLFQYEDYRSFLRDWFQWSRESKRMTQQRFAQMAGLKSHTLMGMIIRGSRNLTADTLRGVKKSLTLNYSEGNYFESLVRLNQARNYQEQLSALAELQSSTLSRASALVGNMRDSEVYLRDWYIPVVRELLKVPFLPHDTQVLSEATGKRIDRTQIQGAIETLKSLGFIELDEKTARYRSSEQAFDFVAPSGRKDLVLRNYHCRILDYTRRAAEEQEVTERELSSICVATSTKKLAIIKQRINEFRRELNLLLHLDDSEVPDQVIMLNTQLLQVLPTRQGKPAHE